MYYTTFASLHYTRLIINEKMGILSGLSNLLSKVHGLGNNSCMSERFSKAKYKLLNIVLVRYLLYSKIRIIEVRGWSRISLGLCSNKDSHEHCP